MKTQRSPMKCPHCGKVYKNLRTPLVPEHTLENLYVQPSVGMWIICPGSGQYPRNALSDKRQLWKDEAK